MDRECTFKGRVESANSNLVVILPDSLVKQYGIQEGDEAVVSYKSLEPVITKQSDTADTKSTIVKPDNGKLVR